MSREIKDSGIEWIAEIPREWKLSKVGRIGEYINGYAFKPEDWGNEGFPIIRIQNLSNTNKEYNMYNGEVEDKYIILNGDYLISWSATLDIFKWKGEKAYLNQHIFKAIPDQEYVSYNYFYWLAKCFMREMSNNKHGSAMQHVTKGIFNNFFIALPEIDEQHKIAVFLDERVSEIDNIIEKTTQSIEEYKKYKQSIITEAVTKGLNPNVEMKNSGVDWIGEIPEHWSMVKIKTLFKEVNYRNLDDENAILLSLFTALGVKPRSEMEDKGNKASTVINYKIVNKGDVIVNKLLAWMGAIAYSEYDGVTSPDYDVYRSLPNANVLQDYYNSYFRYTNFKDDCYKYGRGIMLMRWRTYADEFKNIFVVNPPIEEQMDIANYLNNKIIEIDSLIAQKEKLLTDLESYKKSLIYECVTGKREVN